MTINFNDIAVERFILGFFKEDPKKELYFLPPIMKTTIRNSKLAKYKKNKQGKNGLVGHYCPIMNPAEKNKKTPAGILG